MNLALIGSNEILLERARRMGVYCILVHEPHMVSSVASGLAHETLLTIPDADIISSYLKSRNVQACVSLSERYLELCGKLNQMLEIDGGESLRLAQITKNKGQTRNALEGFRFNLPFKVSPSCQSFREFLEEHKDIIAKPLQGVGSGWVVRINSQKQLNNFILETDLSDYIIEKFVAGSEYSVETISQDGCHQVVGVTKKFLYPGTFVEQQQLAGPFSRVPYWESLVYAAKDVLARLGVKNGVFHSEFIVDSSGGQVFFVETHNRVGGCSIPELWNLRHGFDLYSEYLRLNIGEKIQVVNDSSQNPKMASSYYFSMKHISNGKKIATEYLRCSPHIIDYRLFYDIIASGCEVRSSGTRPGYFVIFGENDVQFENLMRETLSRIYL